MADQACKKSENEREAFFWRCFPELANAKLKSPQIYSWNHCVICLNLLHLVNNVEPSNEIPHLRSLASNRSEDGGCKPGCLALRRKVIDTRILLYLAPGILYCCFCVLFFFFFSATDTMKSCIIYQLRGKYGRDEILGQGNIASIVSLTGSTSKKSPHLCFNYN